MIIVALAMTALGLSLVFVQLYVLHRDHKLLKKHVGHLHTHTMDLVSRLDCYEDVRKDVAILHAGSYGEKPYWCKEDEI